jgi:hypothetical protein
MSKRIAKFKNKKRIAVFSLSKDWNTLTPWLHKNEPTGYFSWHRNLSDSGNVLFNYFYLGPIGVVIAKWVG